MPTYSTTDLKRGIISVCRWLTRLFSPSLSFTLQFHYFQRFFRAYNKAYCFSRSLYWYSLTRTRTRTKATSTPSHKNDAQGLARHTNSSLFGCLPRSGLVSVCGKAASFREARDERGRVSSPLSSRPSTRRMLTCTRVCVDGNCPRERGFSLLIRHPRTPPPPLVRHGCWHRVFVPRFHHRDRRRRRRRHRHRHRRCSPSKSRCH